MPTEALSILQQSALFRGVGSSRLRAMAMEAVRQTFPRKAELVRQGDQSTVLVMVVDGAAKMVSITADGRQIVHGLASVGDVVGCSSAFRQLPYNASAVAIEPCAVLRWNTAHVLAWLREAPLFTNALALLGAQADDLALRLSELLQGNVEQRLSRNLIRLSARGRTGRDVHMSRRDLADFCGTTLFTVSRTLQRWERAGLVRSSRECVTVLHPDLLQRLSQAHAPA